MPFCLRMEIPKNPVWPFNHWPFTIVTWRWGQRCSWEAIDGGHVLHLGSSKGRHWTEVASLAYRRHQRRLLLHLHSGGAVIIRRVQKEKDAKNRDYYIETRYWVLPIEFYFQTNINKAILHHILGKYTHHNLRKLIFFCYSKFIWAWLEHSI